MKRILLLVVFVFALFVSGNSQQRYIFTQYFLNPSLINPGAAGFEKGQSLFFNYRNTWAGYKGSPRSYSLSYDGRITDKVGLGAFVMSDTYGALQTQKGLLSYSYNIKGDKYDIGLGFTTEYISYKAIAGLDGGPVDREDPLLADRQVGDKIFDVAIGAFGKLYDNFIVSITIPSLVRSKLNSKTSTKKDEREFNFILGVGYIYDVPNYDMKICPSIFAKKLRLYESFIDANLLFSFYDETLFSGITYGLYNANKLGFVIGGRINKIQFNYSYDFTFKDFQTYNNGSHEIGIGYRFN